MIVLAKDMVSKIKKEIEDLKDKQSKYIGFLSFYRKELISLHKDLRYYSIMPDDKPISFGALDVNEIQYCEAWKPTSKGRAYVSELRV